MHCLTKNIPKMWLSAHYSGGAIKPKTLWGRVIQQHTHLHYNIANGPVVDYNRVVVCIGANPGIELILNYTVGSLSEHCSYTLLAEKKTTLVLPWDLPRSTHMKPFNKY